MESRPPDPDFMNQPSVSITSLSATEIPDMTNFDSSMGEQPAKCEKAHQVLSIQTPPPLVVESSSQLAGRSRRRSAGGNTSAAQNLKVSKNKGKKLDWKKKSNGKRNKSGREAMDEDDCDGDDEDDIHLDSTPALDALQIPIGSIPVGIATPNPNEDDSRTSQISEIGI